MLTRLPILAPLAALLLASSAGAQTAPIIVGPAGAYRITVKGPVSIAYQADGTAVITFGGEAPTPPGPVDPPPAPEPPPTPDPAVPEIVGPAWLMVVYDDAAPPAYLPGDNHSYAQNRELVVTQRTKADPVAAGWLTSTGRATPAFVVIGRSGDQKGVALHSGPLPQSEAAFRALIDQMKPAKPGR